MNLASPGARYAPPSPDTKDGAVESESAPRSVVDKRSHLDPSSDEQGSGRPCSTFRKARRPPYCD